MPSDVDAPAVAIVKRLGRLHAARRLRAISVAIASLEALRTETVYDLREEGATWDQLGSLLGMTRQGAHRRYAAEAPEPSGGWHCSHVSKKGTAAGDVDELQERDDPPRARTSSPVHNPPKRSRSKRRRG